MLLLSLLFAVLADAQGLPAGLNHLRFGCSQITVERLDPLDNPGFFWDTSHPSSGGCTCGPADDLSNYWTANVYFKARNGSYKRVPQVPNRLLFNDKFTTQTSGGVTVYYTSPGKGKVTAFKPGFRMLVGDPKRRTKKYKMQSYYRCYSGPNFLGDNQTPCSDSKLDSEAFPTGPCLGGIRSDILHPTCWDGKNLDTPNHQDHVAYPTAGPSNFLSTGDCPSTHPVKVPQLMLEVVWDTTKFNNKAEWPADGSQPFVLSTGDPTGYEQHGDYVFGWKGDALQRAMDDNGCFSATCGNQKSQDISVAIKCTIPNRVVEDTDGWMSTLPGNPMGG